MQAPLRPGLGRRALLRGAAGAAGAAGLLYGYAFHVEPWRLETVRVDVPVPRLPPAFDGLTIAHVSDLHLGPLVDAAHVRAVVSAVLDLRPSLVALTGDYVTSLDSGEASLLAEELSRLAAPLGVYGVLGNHDHWTDAAAVADALGRAGVVHLRNGGVAIRRGEDVVYLVGVDDVWEERDDLAAALADVPAEGVAILLAHEPDFADEASGDRRVALQLSGHSHGGQVRLPGLPRVLPTLGHKYPEGLRRVGSLYLYTTRGVGVVGPGVRLNCRPEVTLLRLRR